MDLPLVVALGTVRAHIATQVAWHSHDAHELLFVLQGATTYEFQDRPCVSVAGGHYLFIPRGIMHRGAYGVRMPSTLSGIQFDPERRQARRHTVFTQADLAWLRNLVRNMPLSLGILPDDLRRIIVQMMEEAEAFHSGRQDVATMVRLRALECLVVFEVCRQLASPAKTEPTELVSAAEAYLSEHLAEPVQVRDLARHLGMNRTRVFTMFQSATGQTPNDYLTRLRIERGCHLLTATERTITDIALACGFSSGQYFSSVFWRFIRMRPTEYRQRYARSR